MQDQIRRTDVLLTPHLSSNRIFFRAPYGKWSPEVDAELNRNPGCSVDHIGPIHWDVAGIDCFYWKNGKSVEDTVHWYLAEIDKAGKGIVVMHDEIADMDVVKPLNRTAELTRKLIPALLEKGYRFISLGDMKNLPGEDDRFYIRCGKSGYIGLNEAGEIIEVSGKGNGGNAAFKPLFLEKGKMAIVASNNRLWSFSDGIINAHSTESGDMNRFDFIPIRNNEFVLRVHNGNFVRKSDKRGEPLNTNAEYMRQASVFKFVPVTAAYIEKRTFSDKVNDLGRRLAFIKSKILQR
jgi:hypothetical protein